MANIRCSECGSVFDSEKDIMCPNCKGRVILESDIIDHSETFFIPASGTIRMGRYPQENRIGDPIEWITLCANQDKVLLLSKRGLDCRCVNRDREICRFVRTNQRTLTKINVKVDWLNSGLREWLNTEFIQKAFTDAERNLISRIVLDNAEKKENSRDYEGDMVYLLSEDEVIMYLQDSGQRKCKITKHAQRKGAFINSEKNGWWWIRSNGIAESNSCLGYVLPNGRINSAGTFVDTTHIAVRPAIWVDISVLQKQMREVFR